MEKSYDISIHCLCCLRAFTWKKWALSKKSSTTKTNEHTPSGYSMFTKCSFNGTKNKLDCYRGKDCMEKFCKNLKEHLTKKKKKKKKKWYH